VLGVLLLALAASADQQVFHGWSKDGTWLAWEDHGANDLVELYFCATSAEVKPTWPAALNEAEREEVGGLSCVHLMDPNKAPWQWKAQLVLPAPAQKFNGVEVLHELSLDGDSPGFVLQSGDKKQGCYASGVRERSKLQKTWFHPSGRYVAALIDGNFAHCVVTVKAAAPAGKPAHKR
jgi:hypothetical protein